MDYLQTLCTGSKKKERNTWTVIKFVMRLIFVLCFLMLVCWIFSHGNVRYNDLHLASLLSHYLNFVGNQLQLHELQRKYMHRLHGNYMLIWVISFAVFVMMIIVHVFFKRLFPSSCTSYLGIMTSDKMVLETERASLTPVVLHHSDEVRQICNGDTSDLIHDNTEVDDVTSFNVPDLCTAADSDISNCDDSMQLKTCSEFEVSNHQSRLSQAGTQRMSEQFNSSRQNSKHYFVDNQRKKEQNSILGASTHQSKCFLGNNEGMDSQMQICIPSSKCSIRENPRMRDLNSQTELIRNESKHSFGHDHSQVKVISYISNFALGDNQGMKEQCSQTETHRQNKQLVGNNLEKQEQSSQVQSSILLSKSPLEDSQGTKEQNSQVQSSILLSKSPLEDSQGTKEQNSQMKTNRQSKHLYGEITSQGRNNQLQAKTYISKSSVRENQGMKEQNSQGEASGQTKFSLRHSQEMREQNNQVLVRAHLNKSSIKDSQVMKENNSQMEANIRPENEHSLRDQGANANVPVSTHLSKSSIRASQGIKEQNSLTEATKESKHSLEDQGIKEQYSLMETSKHDSKVLLRDNHDMKILGSMSAAGTSSVRVRQGIRQQNSQLEVDKHERNHSSSESQVMRDQSRKLMHGQCCGFSFNPERAAILSHEKRSIKEVTDSAIQTSILLPPIISFTTGTMTINPELVDKSVGTQEIFKFVRSCDTITSGPFMKKLRRAQRLLKEAKVKFKSEHQDKVNTWRAVMMRYKARLQTLSDTLDKKDKLLSYTALNRALSENEVKDMCTSVSSARDRLLTQCKLNFALKDVVESKCETGSSDSQSSCS